MGNVMSGKPRDKILKGENGHSCPLLLSGHRTVPSGITNREMTGDSNGAISVRSWKLKGINKEREVRK